MKRLLATVVIIILMFSAAGCKSASPDATPVSNGSDNEQTENINIIPFSDRRYLITNGTAETMKQITEKRDNINIDKSYPVLSGMKNKDLQDKLNKEMAGTMEKLLKDLEAEVKADSNLSQAKVNYESSSAYITYNYNNVMFVEYYANMDLILKNESKPWQRLKSRGYDLNTGKTLELKDLFKQGFDYEKFINDYISLYIIKYNYDDPDSDYMSRPFQGIRKDQGFSMDSTGLRILLDEKNNEFIYRGYPSSIYIPLKTAGPELALFDKYYLGKESLFEKNGIKKLLQNQLEYKVTAVIQKSSSNSSIYVEKGEFINIKDAKLKKLLDDFVVCTLDVEGFKERSGAAPKKVYYGNIGHHVNLVMNAGGYISIMVLDSQYENGSGGEQRRFLNYNLDKNKSMKLSDIFIPGFDYKTAIAKILANTPEYKQSQEYTFKESDLSLLSQDNFFFDEYGVTINLDLQGRNKYQNYFNIPYEKIGYNNLALYK